MCAHLFKQFHLLDLSTQAKESFPSPRLHYLVFHSLHIHTFWWITNQQLWGLMACLGMVNIVGYSRCFQTSTFPPFFLFTHHSLWTKYSKRIIRKVFQNNMTNSTLHSSRPCLFLQKQFWFKSRNQQSATLFSDLTFCSVFCNILLLGWAFPLLISDFQSPFSLQKKYRLCLQ